MRIQSSRFYKEDGPQISGSISVSPENSAGKRKGKKIKSRKPIVPTITIGGSKVNERYVKYFKEGYGDFSPEIGQNFDSNPNIRKFAAVVHGAQVFRVFDTAEEALSNNPNCNPVEFSVNCEVGKFDYSPIVPDVMNWGTGEFSYERYIAVYNGNQTSNLLKNVEALCTRFSGRNSAQLPISICKVTIAGKEV